MNHLKNISKKYKALMLLYIVTGLAWTFLQGFGTRYFQKVIDDFTNNTLTLTTIVVYGLALIAMYILSYLQNYPERKLEHGIELSLKTDALRKMSVIDYLSYVKIGTGTLIQQIENGAVAGSNILFGFYLRLASELLPQMLFSIAFIFVINRTVMIWILTGYVIVFTVTNLLLKALYKIKATILVNEEKFNHFIVRGFMEMVVFRVNRRFEHEIHKAEMASGKIIDSKVKMKLIHEAFFTIFVILVCILKVGIIVYGWTANTLTIGEIVALIALLDNAYMPIAIFNVCYVQYKLDMVAFTRYTDFLDAKEDGHLMQGKIISQIKGNVSFSQVYFNYNEREIFRNFNLDIQHGKTIAFVGESGSGKSTAVKLLVGLLHPNSGNIFVDGYDLSKVNLNSYYENIAYLPQEPPIFDGTLRENLIFDYMADDSVLIDAIRKAGLESLYLKLESGLDTQLGERGINRLDSIKSFDNIIVFQDGNIVEQGKFNELIEKHQSFYELRIFHNYFFTRCGYLFCIFNKNG